MSAISIRCGWGTCLALLALTTLGCGGASMVLKSPIEERCRDAGLRGCPELAEGITEYVDGDKNEAQRQILKAGAENSPAQIKEFADKLRTLREVPGADQYVGPVLQVADMLVADSGGARAAKSADGGDKPKGRAANAESAAPTTLGHWQYLVETFPKEDASDRLNSLGKLGWELVTAAPDTSGILCVLKRPAPR